VYGRQMYEIMRYWDDDHPEWEAAEHAFAAAGRRQPKWVVSRSMQSVGPNTTLIAADLGSAIRALKAERVGEIEVAGPTLARSLTDLGLIDAYRLYLHPVVLGHGTPYFAGPRPPHATAWPLDGQTVVASDRRSSLIGTRRFSESRTAPRRKPGPLTPFSKA
jgi:dihydrofolate reductase